MTRRPLRPLTRVFAAREKGDDIKAIEAEERARRNQEMAIKQRRQAETRLLVLSVIFCLGFLAVAGRMAVIASMTPQEPKVIASGTQILNARADIVDRTGKILATNLTTQALYAQPPLMVDPKGAAEGLAKLFPDLDKERLIDQFTSGKRKFVWVKRRMSPEQIEMVRDLGEPGLLFGPREMRLYPNGKIASHVLGGASFGKEGVKAAEIVGVAGVEKYFDAQLRDYSRNNTPLTLSLDLTAQSITREVLKGGMAYMNAKGASAVLMDVNTGEVISLSSLPDFDPNDRPNPLLEKDPSESPLFNRAAQGVYELGSTFKLFTAGVALERGEVDTNTLIDTKSPLVWGRYKIKDYSKHDPQMTVRDVIVESSNVGTARMALTSGATAQQDMLKKLGFFDPITLEIIEASGSQPLLPKKWSDISTMTISYGHGIAASPLHLARAYAAIGNGGKLIQPTLLKQWQEPAPAPSVFSERTSAKLRDMLRGVVEEGTATMAEVPGYEVGGKTGTADKPKPSGGYYEDRVITTFAALFPISKPKYVLIVTLDEPKIEALGEERRTAGWTAVPVAAEIITRVAPVLGLRPRLEERPELTYTSTE